MAQRRIVFHAYLEQKSEFGADDGVSIQRCFEYAKVVRKISDAGVCGFLPSITLESSFLSVSIGVVSNKFGVQYRVEKIN